MVVFTPSVLGQDLCLLERVENLAVEEFVSELAVERLDSSFLPEGAGFNQERLRSQFAKSSTDYRGHELGSMVTPHVLGEPCFKKSSESV